MPFVKVYSSRFPAYSMEGQFHYPTQMTQSYPTLNHPHPQYRMQSTCSSGVGGVDGEGGERRAEGGWEGAG